MDYYTIYHKIIEKGLIRGKKRFKYSAKHHIIPTACGGQDESDNWVFLTNREHFVCHRLLCKIYKKGSAQQKSMIFAFWRMCNGYHKKGKGGFRITNRVYEIGRQQYIENHPQRDEMLKKKIKTRRENGEYDLSFHQKISSQLKLFLSKMTPEEKSIRAKNSFGACDQEKRSQSIAKGKASQYLITRPNGDKITVWTYENLVEKTGYTNVQLKYRIKTNNGEMPDGTKVEYITRYPGNDSHIGRAKNRRKNSKNSGK
jgi:hypothetical protein